MGSPKSGVTSSEVLPPHNKMAAAEEKPERVCAYLWEQKSPSTSQQPILRVTLKNSMGSFLKENLPGPDTSEAALHLSEPTPWQLNFKITL